MRRGWVGRRPVALIGLLFLLAGHEIAGHEPLRTRPQRSAVELFPGGRAELGLSEAELRERFSDALRPGRLSRVSAATGGEVRVFVFHRELGGDDLAHAEYELWNGELFRVRWRLAERFERPIFPELVHRARHLLGEPLFDQELEGRLATGRVPLRRVGWTRGGLSFELRQLQPLNGGAVYLTLTDQRTVEAILAGGGSVPPQPDRAAPWWESASGVVEPVTGEDRLEMLWDFEDLVRTVAPRHGPAHGA